MMTSIPLEIGRRLAALETWRDRLDKDTADLSRAQVVQQERLTSAQTLIAEIRKDLREIRKQLGWRMVLSHAATLAAIVGVIVMAIRH